MFLIGVVITRLWARKKDWDDCFKTTLIVNLLWFVVSLIVSLVFAFGLSGYDWLSSLISLIINLIIGAIIVSKLYDKEFGESLIFVIVIQIILFIIGLILGFILGFILALIIIGS